MIGSVCCPRLSKKSLKRVRPVNRTLGAVLQRNQTEHIRQNGALQFRKKGAAGSVKITADSCS